jgi:hypothetical protein
MRASCENGENDAGGQEDREATKNMMGFYTVTPHLWNKVEHLC